MASDKRLVTVADAKLELRVTTNDNDALLAKIIDRVSDRFNGHFARTLVYPDAAWTEFHTIREPRVRLWLRDYPVLASPAIQVWEDQNRVFDASSLLTEDDDYVVDRERGVLTRVSGSDEILWEAGVRVVKVVYHAGYVDTSNDKANIPPRLQGAALQLIGLIYREIERKKQGISTQVDIQGSTGRAFIDRLVSAHLGQQLRDEVAEFVRISQGVDTSER